MRITLPLAGLLAVAVLAAPSDVSAQQWSTVKGKVVYGGKAPPAPVPVAGVPAGAMCPAALANNELEVDAKTLGIRYAIVSLAPVEKGGKLPIAPALLKPPVAPEVVDQPKCLFEPRVVALREGQDLLVKNSSKVVHNVSWNAKAVGGGANDGNVIIPAGNSNTIKGLGVSKVPSPISCSIHPWMGGKVAVFDHPYFAVTNEKGEFEIKDAPVGKYKLMVWHESYGWQNKDGLVINISAEKAVDETVTFPAK